MVVTIISSVPDKSNVHKIVTLMVYQSADKGIKAKRVGKYVIESPSSPEVNSQILP